MREPADDRWLSLTERPGFLRLRGRTSLQSLFDQSLVGFRVLHLECELVTRLEFAPRTFQQSAGLALYYNTSNFYYLHVTADEVGTPFVRLLGCSNRTCTIVASQPVKPGYRGGFELSAILCGESLQFLFRLDGDAQQAFGPAVDATILSDDYPKEGGLGLAFTGLFAALCSQDSSAEETTADFDWFRYRGASVASRSMGSESSRNVLPARDEMNRGRDHTVPISIA